jgi:NAD(P)H-flavin reductase
LFRDELAAWAKRDDVEFFETVDKPDGSWKGNVGVITTLFPKVEFDPVSTVCAIVGPPVMYKFIVLELRERKVPYGNILLSLERRMKCGVGKCGHCQIQGLYVCKDGPVFRFSDIQQYKEAI